MTDADERAMLQVIDERDEAFEWADKLAMLLAPTEVLGEHSNTNEPWQNAYNYAMEHKRTVHELIKLIQLWRHLRGRYHKDWHWSNMESRRIKVGRWEFYRDKRDWWVGVFFSQPATYFCFLTLVAKRRMS